MIGLAPIAITLLQLVSGSDALPSETLSIDPPTTSSNHLEAAAAPEWEFSLSAYTYIVPHDRDYVQATLTADFDWLHLEGRYQYEDFDTASVWLGYNFSLGEKLTLDFTPMIGGVFGDTDGVAPGYEVTLAWRQFEFYTEGEFVFDAHDSDDDFFYSWSELTYAPFDWLRAGVAAQRTKIRGEDHDLEFGPMVGLTYGQADFTGYLFFPDDGDPTVVLGVSLTF